MSRGKHAFKILCPEPLTSGILGHRGSTKDRIQDECQCRLVMSNRDEFYPGTRLRLVVVQAEEQYWILKALDRILELLADCAETERQSPNGRTAVQGEADFLGKEAGELVLRAAVPVRVGSAIIGPKGAHVQALKEEAGAKITIDKEHRQMHQLCRLAARPEGIRIILNRISEHLAEDCVQRPKDFESWAAIRSFDWQEDHGQGRDTREGYGRDGHGRDGREFRDRDGPRDAPRDGGRYGHDAQKGGHGPNYGQGTNGPSKPGGALSRGRPRSASPRRHRSRSPGRFAAARPPAPLPMETLASALSGLQEGALDFEYEVTCELPPHKVSAMIGPGGQIVRNVRHSTGTLIHFAEGPQGQREQTMHIKGPLLGVYRAHVMMMRRYHEHEAEALAPKGHGPSPAKGGKGDRRGWDAPGRESRDGREGGKGKAPGRGGKSRGGRHEGDSREHLEGMLESLQRQLDEVKGKLGR
mmetsp:Transcript_18992/g.35621  ORF Transcript_18992/g.35621 Transcript_18992/m.35621 type:complete len:470 (+) Transcript_18992:36-1445(+)